MMLCEKKSHCQFAIAVSRETGSSRTLNKIANRACKARADWVNHFYGPWESKGYAVESQKDRVHLT